MTRIASQDEATEHLSPHLGDIATVIRAGWREWTELPSEKAIDWTPRTRANVVHDGITKDCRARFGEREHEGIAVSEKRKFVAITFDNKFILRFKKLNGGKLRTTGVDTRQRLDFLTQRIPLPGMPNVTNLIAGYRLDRLEHEIEGIFITCPSGIRHNAWTMQLDDGVVSTGTVRALSQPSGLFTWVKVRSAIVREDDVGEMEV